MSAARLTLLRGVQGSLSLLGAGLQLLRVAPRAHGRARGLLGGATLVASALLGLPEALPQALRLAKRLFGRLPALRRHSFGLLGPPPGVARFRLGCVEGFAGPLHRSLAVLRHRPGPGFLGLGRLVFAERSARSRYPYEGLEPGGLPFPCQATLAEVRSRLGVRGGAEERRSDASSDGGGRLNAGVRQRRLRPLEEVVERGPVLFRGLGQRPGLAEVGAPEVVDRVDEARDGGGVRVGDAVDGLDGGRGLAELADGGCLGGAARCSELGGESIAGFHEVPERGGVDAADFLGQGLGHRGFSVPARRPRSPIGPSGPHRRP